MGNSLHQKIYLGRVSVLQSRRVQALLLLAGFSSIGIVWFALQQLR